MRICYKVLWISVFLFTASAHAQAQVASPAQITLEWLENLALENNPTLKQSDAAIHAAQGMARQAGLRPNPYLGIKGDQVHIDQNIKRGNFGAYLEQNFVTGGRYAKSRRTSEQDVALAETDAAIQKQRVLNTVRTLFYQALATQRRLEVRTKLADLIKEANSISKQLQNVGQADVPDVLEIEIEAERADLAVVTARNEEAEIWAKLSAAIGGPALKPVPLVGDIETIPILEENSTLSSLLRNSPEVKNAETGIKRAQAALDQARVEKSTEFDVKGGLEFNRGLLVLSNGALRLEGFFEVKVTLPLSNRNQGGVDAARAEVARSQLDTQRVSLSLRSRLATTYRQYLDSRQTAERYRTELLPRAQRAFDLYLSSFRQMAAAYPQALIAQRTLFQLQDDYNDALERSWMKTVEIQGLLIQADTEFKLQEQP